MRSRCATRPKVPSGRSSEFRIAASNREDTRGRHPPRAPSRGQLELSRVSWHRKSSRAQHTHIVHSSCARTDLCRLMRSSQQTRSLLSQDGTRKRFGSFHVKLRHAWTWSVGSRNTSGTFCHTVCKACYSRFSPGNTPINRLGFSSLVEHGYQQKPYSSMSPSLQHGL